MDPWADDDGSMGFDNADDRVLNKPSAAPSSPVHVRPSMLAAAAGVDEDPWADSNAARQAEYEPEASEKSGGNHTMGSARAPSVELTREEANRENAKATSHPDRAMSDNGADNSFDPWGERANSGFDDVAEDRETTTTMVKEPEEVGVMVDPDDPWGSGAAARIAKIEREQEIKDIAQRLEQVNRANEVEEERTDKEAKDQKTDGGEEQKADATATSGWKSFFSRAAKPAAAQDAPITKAAEESNVKPASDEVSSLAAKGPESETTSIKPAPRLWQAPSLKRGNITTASNHGRSSSSLTSPVGSSSSPVQGPGWEQTTSKKPVNAAQGGLFGGLFGGGSGGGSTASGMGSVQAAEKLDNAAKGASSSLESRLDAIRQNLRPPPVVSAMDPEDQDYETEETGLEWDDSTNEIAHQRAGATKPNSQSQPPSTVARLFGRWRRAESTNTETGAKSHEGMTTDDLSWLESVGTNQLQANKPAGMDAAEEEDWLKFVSDTTATSSSGQTSLASRSVPGMEAMLPHPPPLSPPPPRLSGPPRSAVNRQSLLDFDSFTQTPQGQASGLSRSQSASSPSSARRGMGASQLPQQGRLPSGASMASAGTPSSVASMDAFGDFDKFESSPAVSQQGWDGQWDERTNASSHRGLLNGRSQAETMMNPGVRARLSSESPNQLGSRRPRGKYDYDEEEAEEDYRGYDHSRAGDTRFAAYKDEVDHHYDEAVVERGVIATSTKQSSPPSQHKPGNGGNAASVSSRTSSPALSFPPPPSNRTGRPLSVQMNRNAGSVSSSQSGISFPPPPPPPTGWKSAHALAPKPALSPPPVATAVPRTEQQSLSRPPTKLSQGKGLTNDDLSFFENL